MRLLKKCLLLGLSLLLFTSLVSAQTGFIRVIVLTKSGAPDNSFDITSSSDIQTMQNMLTNLQPTSAPNWPQFGFRGYALDNNGVSSFPATLRVFNGTIEIYSSTSINFFVDSNGLESFLQSKAGSAAAAAAVSPELSSQTSTAVAVLCCGGGGGGTPSPTPAPSPSPSPTPSPTPLPLSGSELTYDPGPWNKPGVVTNNNCYAYATNQMTGTFPQPGKGTGKEPTPPYTCDNVTAGAVSDGLVQANCNNACPKGSYKVALVINPDATNNDYHWYRQDSNGNWSHKPGATDATNLDNSGKPIIDPRTADRGGYTTFCGCFCVNPSNVTVK